jgi:glycosyltransferase involved in cell wall biosynthesis
MRLAAETAYPLVSVILPTHNRAYCLPSAIGSVLGQTYKSFQLIIVDDASTDQTESLIAGMDDPRIEYVRNARNLGAAAARNVGVRQAVGELLAFQDSDDQWLLEKLEFQVRRLHELGETHGATFGGKILYGRDGSGRFGPDRVCFRPVGSSSISGGSIAGRLLQGNIISPQTLLLRKSAFDSAGSFDERLPANEDWEFMLRLSGVTNIDFTMRPLVVAKVSEDSISYDDRRSARSFIIILGKLEAVLQQDEVSYCQKLFALSTFLTRIGRFRAAERAVWRAIRLRPSALGGWLRLARLKVNRVRRRMNLRTDAPPGRQ